MPELHTAPALSRLCGIFFKWVKISPEIDWYTYFLGWDGKIRVWTALLMQFKTMLPILV